MAPAPPPGCGGTHDQLQFGGIPTGGIKVQPGGHSSGVGVGVGHVGR